MDGSTEFHNGFLFIAEAMKHPVAKGMAEILASSGSGPVDELVFTGHSAGGAVAQLFYFMAMTPGQEMAALVPRKYLGLLTTYGTVRN